MDFGVIWVDANRHAIGGDCVFKLALVLERIAEVYVNPDIVRLDADGLAIGGYRLVERALVLKRVAKVEVSAKVIRPDADRLAIWATASSTLPWPLSAAPRLE